MGSFNVGCGISNLSIEEGDNTGFMIIGKPKEYDTGYPKSMGHAPFYTYGTDVYRPFMPPVFGKYDDYGRISDIRPSVTTEVIENIFRRPIADVLAVISCDRGVYDSNSQITEKYFTGNSEAIKGDSIKDDLVSLGFTHTQSVEGEELLTFNGFQIVSHDDTPYYTIIQEGNNRVLKSRFHADEVFVILEFFGQITANYPGFDKEDYGIIRLMDSLSGFFFLESVYEKMTAFIKEDNELRENRENFSNKWEEFLSNVKDDSLSDGAITIHSKHTWAADALFHNTIFPMSLIGHMLPYQGTDEFESMKDMLLMMRALNRMFQPSYCGEQYGNGKAERALQEVTAPIIEERLKYYADDDE